MLSICSMSIVLCRSTNQLPLTLSFSLTSHYPILTSILTLTHLRHSFDLSSNVG